MKKKTKKKKYLLILILLFTAALLIINRLNTTHYSKAVLNVLNNNQKKELTSNPYSKTLEEVILNNIFIDSYFKEYLNITYQERDNFIYNVNKLLRKGYNAEEINILYEFSDNTINKALEKEHINIKDYKSISNFNIDNYDRYQEYRNKSDYSLKDIVTYINVGVDLKPYTTTNQIQDGDDYLVLVNKFNGLNKNYKPKDLEPVDGYYGNSVYMRKQVKESFLALQNTIKNEINITLVPTTAYRGYNFQQTLYNNYVETDGTLKADTYSARPGYSEHQTGLAIDLKNPSATTTRLNDLEYNWLKENAYKYGFIIRFPKDKELITGYQEENWHIRYVGNETAKIIYNNNLSLEEYIDLYINEY